MYEQKKSEDNRSIVSRLFLIARDALCVPDITSKIIAQLPVIGPHGGNDNVIIGKLLLSGTKRLGWIDLLPSDVELDESRPSIQAQRKIETRLAKAVEQGYLKSTDVVYVLKGTTRKFISRHYCQPGCENDLEVVAAFNRKAFNFEKPDVRLEKPMGDYLGYRKRDQVLFGAVQRFGSYIPQPIMNGIYRFNEHVTQPAYVKQLLKASLPTRSWTHPSRPSAAKLPNGNPSTQPTPRK